MSRYCPIALAGLSPTERVLIEGALFPPSGSPIPGAYLEPDLARARLIIACANDAVAVAALKARALPGRVLLLGGSDRGTGWPYVVRPLRLHAVLELASRLLDAPPAAAGAEVEPKSAAAERRWLPRFAPRPMAFVDTVAFAHLDSPDARDFAETRQLEPAGDASHSEATPPRGAPRWAMNDFQATQQFSPSVPSVTPSDWEAEVADWEQVQADRSTVGKQAAPESPTQPAVRAPSSPPEPQTGSDAPSTTPAKSPDRILIVGAAGSAADGLIRALLSAGFLVDFAAGGQAALELMGRRPFQFIILIEVSLGPQAIVLCRELLATRGLSPADLRVMIVASHRGLLSRIRAWFAGCNAWMNIPLKQEALIQYLRLNGSGNALRA